MTRRRVVRTLEKRGHGVTTAANGRLALQAITRAGLGSFDVALMDVQMPEMDGLSATSAIREHEKGVGTHLPIVAMTAHAMEGDRQRRLSAGMDDYLSKPVRAGDLLAIIERASGEPTDVAKPAARPPRLLVVDRGAALARLDGDRRLLGELVRIFRADTPAMMAAIRQAVAGKNADAVRLAAHALKGSLAAVGATRAFEAARRLETIGREDDLRRASAGASVSAQTGRVKSTRLHRERSS